MLLAIDVGNTNTVFALFKEKTEQSRLREAQSGRDYTMLGSWRSVTEAQRTSDEYAVFLRTLVQEKGITLKDVKAAIIGSVVPDANFHLTKFCREHIQCEPLMVGSPEVETGIKVLIDRPEEMGADRIVDAVGGASAYKPPLLIIDFGTATTFNVIDADGNCVGGAIAPGINLSLQALHMAAAKLPRIGIAPTEKVIAKNTNDAIRSGIYWGYVGLIEGMIARIKNEFGKPMTVVATGGLAPMFTDVVKSIDHVNDHMTLQGLCEIYERTCRRRVAK
jgi:type III pantothenate kinase